jgi:hypothetical protein
VVCAFTVGSLLTTVTKIYLVDIIGYTNMLYIAGGISSVNLLFLYLLNLNPKWTFKEKFLTIGRASEPSEITRRDPINKSP